MDEILAKVMALLTKDGHYKELKTPLRVGDLDFQFECVLTGPGSDGGLIIIATFAETAKAILVRRIRSLVRLLDRLGSKRTVSLILIARGQVSFEATDLDTYCHVVILRPDVSLERSLRPLLPLKLSVPDKHTSSAENALAKELGDSAKDPLIESLVSAAGSGIDPIRERISAAIQECMKDINSERQT